MTSSASITKVTVKLKESKLSQLRFFQFDLVEQYFPNQLLSNANLITSKFHIWSKNIKTLNINHVYMTVPHSIYYGKRP